MKTKVKNIEILQHSTPDANNFVAVKLRKQQKNCKNIRRSNKNSGDEGVLGTDSNWKHMNFYA